MSQDTEAAQRSAHVTRGAAEHRQAETCFVCSGPWRKGGASAFARVGAAFVGVLADPPPVVEVCSAECAADPRFADPHGLARKAKSARHRRPEGQRHRAQNGKPAGPGGGPAG